MSFKLLIMMIIEVFKVKLRKQSHIPKNTLSDLNVRAKCVTKLRHMKIFVAITIRWPDTLL